jgi:hypothetical protein
LVKATFNYFFAVRFADDHLETVMQMAVVGRELVEIPAISIIEVLPS